MALSLIESVKSSYDALSYSMAQHKMKPLKILIISTFFPPLNSIASLRPYSWAKYWTQSGHDVTVLTTEKQPDPSLMLYLPNPGFKTIEVAFPQWLKSLRKDYNSSNKTTQGPKRNKFKQLAIDFFHYLRFQKGVFHSCRMPDISDLWINNAYKAIKDKGEWDLVISTAGPYATHLVGHKVKKNKLAKLWIADYRDTWSNNYIYGGLFPFNLIESILEKRILRKADAVTTISAPFADVIAKEFSHPNVHVIENGFDPEDLINIPANSIFLDDQKFRIVHTGSIYKGRRDPTPLFQAINLLNADPDHYHLLNKLEIIFAGSNQADLQELIDKYEVGKWVRLIGFVKREDALRMQRDANALLFLPWNDPSVNGVLTGKIFEYLFSLTPILAVGANSLEDSQLLIKNAKAGEALLSVAEIKNYLIKHLQHIRKIKNQLSPEVLEKYTRKFQAEKLLSIVNQQV